MAHFSHSAVVAHPLAEVFSWHQRPGALTRLSPEWAQEVVAEAHPPLAPGARAHLRTSLPGSHGVLRVPFVSEHAAGPSEHSFVDRMVRGPLRSWEHTHTFAAAGPDAGAAGQGSGESDSGNACLITDDIDYRLLPAAASGLLGIERALMEPTLQATFLARNDRLAADLDYQQHLREVGGPESLSILIAGASGTIGRQVAALLSTAGHEVRRLVRRRARRTDEVSWDPGRGYLRPDEVAWADVVIHLGGVPIATRFTPAAKDRILSSRVDSTRLLVLAMAELPPQDRPRAFICASGINAYGSSRGDETLTEQAESGDGFLAEVCARWESEASRAADLGVRWVSVRTGVVLTSLSGFLRLQLPLYLAGLGGPLGSGRQWLSWISLDDIARIYARVAVDAELTGPVNAVAPGPVRQREFAAVLGRLAHRPAALSVPDIGPAVLLGKQAAEELAQADLRVAPARLQAAGYRFRYADLPQALAATAGFSTTGIVPE
ncbi:TIGR01777 family oxidoreductase [Brevibacterium daeguense]|uniref:TIGR01777 family oxidoreductase n=1 Tax=Brevibacterium daeguense TaxID=909936 RepID=A0ABP8EIT2_9MICO|nr:TIGR01777 family oxidoreductase [Brevibacterium daeguense]